MSSMQAHLQLNISSQFFAMLSSEQALELSELKQKLSEVNLNRGVSDLCKCSFYQDKKIKIELLRANPDLRNLLAKR